VAEVLLRGREPVAPTPRDGSAPALPAWPWAPAALAFDGDGAVLLATDRGPRPGQLPEMLFRVPVEGPDRGRPSFILAAPVGAAMGGAALVPDGTLLAAVAHPGATAGASWDAPATRWPSLRPEEPSRSTVVTLAR
jgi:hypothetical protein